MLASLLLIAVPPGPQSPAVDAIERVCVPVMAKGATLETGKTAATRLGLEAIGAEDGTFEFRGDGFELHLWQQSPDYRVCEVYLREAPLDALGQLAARLQLKRDATSDFPRWEAPGFAVAVSTDTDDQGKPYADIMVGGHP